MIREPEVLHEGHQLEGFDSGEPSLDTWLIHRAWKNQQSGASRCYVITDEERVIGYYVLAAGSINRSDVPKPMQRNMPNPIPVMVLGRLAIARQKQKQGLGKALLRDAILRTLQAAEIGGIVALLVHALNDQAAAFYQQEDFTPSPIDDKVLLLRLKDIKAAVQEAAS